MNKPSQLPCTAFAGKRQFASGELHDVVHKARVADIVWNPEPVLIFDDLTGRVVEIDLLGTPEAILSRVAEIEGAPAPETEPTLSDGATRGPGRPKLGVVAREVTLLPRHWEWLATQPGGASVALRKLVEEARRTSKDKDRLRAAQEAAYRFISTMAGNEPGFEEAARALFAGNRERFAEMVARWPIDVANHGKKLAAQVFQSSSPEPTSQVEAGPAPAI